MEALKNRLLEPSTYAGLAAFFAGLGLMDLDAGQWNEVFGGLALLFGGSAAAVKERGADDASRPAGRSAERELYLD